MTLQTKHKAISLLIAIGILFILMMMSSCGVNYHLKQSKKHLEKAIAKGAKISADTVYDTITVAIKEVKVDTLVQQVNFNDTITVIKDRVVTKVKVNTVEKSVYIETKCPPDTIKIKVPVAVNSKIETPLGFWYYFVRIFPATALLFLIVGFWLRAGPASKVSIDLSNIVKEKPPN